MNYKSCLFFIVVTVVSISIASYRMPGRKGAQKGWAPLAGSVDAIKVVCLPYGSSELRSGADHTMRKSGAIAKFSTTKNKKSYVCYVKFYTNKDIAQHAGNYTCKCRLFQPETCKLNINASNQGTQLSQQWNNLENQAVMFDKLQPAVQYLNQDPTVEKLPVYMGGAGQ